MQRQPKWKRTKSPTPHVDRLGPNALRSICTRHTISRSFKQVTIMSVRRATCPGCNATLNVPATMTMVKCSSCSTVWDVNNPSAAKKRPSPNRPAAGGAAKPADSGAEQPKKKRSQPAAKKQMYTALATVVGGLVVLLVVAGFAIVLLTGGGDDDSTAQTESTTSDVADTEERETPPAYYRVVKLPESTRKKIYESFRIAASSSVEKKVMIPKNSVAAKGLASTMSSMVDREVQMLSLQHNISTDDVLQIVAEGNDKGWPPKMPKKKTPK